MDLSALSLQELHQLQAELRKAVKAKKEKNKKYSRKIPKALLPEQVEALLGKINVKCPTGLRNRVMFECMARAGLRVSEVVNLTPDHIDLENGWIHVQHGKGDKDRDVPIPDSLRKWLEKWLQSRPESGWLFATSNGKPIMPRYLNQVLERLSKRSGVYLRDGAKKKPVHAHVLRHTAATYWLNQGLNLREVQELLGHANIGTTQVYTHVRPETLKKKLKNL